MYEIFATGYLTISKDNESVTMLPRVGEPDMIGKKKNLSDTDVVKIKKMYKCKPYESWWEREPYRVFLPFG